METFDYFGCTYSINEDKETVSLIDATQAKGKFCIPSQVEYNGKSYLVTGLQKRVEDVYEWIEDRRRKEGGFYKKTEKKTTAGPFAIFYTTKEGLCNGYYMNNDDITSVIIPDSVKNLCERAFFCCENLEEIHLPKSITKIPGLCFCACKHLKRIELHEGITEIEEKAFIRCLSLTEIAIPSTVKTIGCDVFLRCNALKQITIPSTVEAIRRGAFQGCSALTEITIPSSVKTIDDNAFGDCPPGVDPFKCGLEVVNILNDEGAVIIHPNAFTDRVKINYIGKKKAANTSTPKAAKAKNSVNGVTIDLEKLIQAALADGVVTDKERAILIKKVREAGGDVDEFEMLLDARIYESQKKSQPKEVPVKTNDKKTQPQKIEGGNSDFKKSASIKEYFIGILPDGKVVVKKNGEECENAMAALRAIAEAEGFALDPKWLTRQAGNNLVNFLNGKK